jgi:hypothetical protein
MAKAKSPNPQIAELVVKEAKKRITQEEALQNEIEEITREIEAIKETIRYYEWENEWIDNFKNIEFLDDESESCDFYENYLTKRKLQVQSVMKKALELVTLLDGLNDSSRQRIELINSIGSKFKKTIDNNQEF